MQVWWYKETGFLLFINIVNLQVCLFYIPFSISGVFLFCVFDCVVDHAKVSICLEICGKMIVYQIGFFLLKNSYIVPMTSQIFLDSWLVTHLPIFLWFSCLLDSGDNVSQFLVLYFCFQFLHFFSYFSFWFCVSFSSFWMFFFLFCVSLSVFLFPVSVFFFSFLLSFWVVFLFLVAGIYFSNFLFCFF